MKNLFFYILIILVMTAVKSEGQNQQKSKFKFGLRSSYCYKTVHYSADILYVIENHNILIGGNYTYMLDNVNGDPADRFVKNAFGLNAAYRYDFFKNNRLKLSINTDFFIYPYRFYESQQGPPYEQEHINITVENYLSIGVNYNLYKKLDIYTQIGFGSSKGFFLIIDGFMPVFSIGLYL